MISDRLSDASQAIDEYLEGHMYEGIEPTILKVRLVVDALRVWLDTPGIMMGGTTPGKSKHDALFRTLSDLDVTALRAAYNAAVEAP